MKKILIISILVLFLWLALCSCSKDKDTYIYVGKGQSWLATYSLIKIDSNYYDSLSIQYLFDENNSNNITEKVSPIEFCLKGNSLELSTSYPRDLEGVASLHTSTIYNSDALKITFDDYVELTIYWKDKKETFKLYLYK
jgi:hypothetical protein